MQKEIIINAVDNHQRIAIVEDGKLAELFIESEDRERMVGDIYYGTVDKVMPGLQAAFVNLGLDQDAFLHYSDIGSEFRELLGESDTSSLGERGEEEEEQKGRGRGDRQQRRRRRPASRVTLQKGQDIVVQIFKEPVGTKGVRVTTEVSLPGRFLVLMPYDGKVGVSRKIPNFKEKRRLRRIVQSMLPSGFGAIIRTVAAEMSEEVIRADMQTLLQTWRDIERKMRTAKPPTLIHKDMDTSASAIRDLFSEDVTRVATDSRRMYREIRAYLNLVAPNRVDVLEFHGSNTPIFDTQDLERQIQQSMNRRVWLKSGGYIIIDHTEAMKVIDVNSGRYAAKRDQELNILRINLEAAKEIARQLRLRDLGGIIVIDFIDMEVEENKRKLLEEMRREMRRDRAKYTILPVTDFGLMQITRQRVRESVQMSVSDTCPTCTGTGRVHSKAAMLTQLERWMRRFRGNSQDLRLLLRVHPTMATFLTEGTIPHVTHLMLKYFVRIRVQPDPLLPVDEFRLFSRRTDRDITAQFR